MMKCRICGNETDNQEYEVKEMMYGYRDTHLYFQCSKCSCLQIREFPTNLQKYYDDSYYSYQTAQKKSKLKNFLLGVRNKYALFGSGLIGRILYSKYPITKFKFFQPLRTQLGVDSAILDVGCGSGQLLHMLHNAGFNKLSGVDPFIENDIKYENGLTIKKQFIHDVQGNFDMVMLHHSFEHIPDQLDTLQSVFDLLVPGGYCLIRIPIVSSYAWKYYGVNWVQLDAPRHFFLHSIESIKILSTKIGFELTDVIYDSTAFHLWGSEQYLKDIPLKDDRSYDGINPQNSIFSAEDIALFSSRAEKLNLAEQGDQAIFYLQKPNKTSVYS